MKRRALRVAIHAQEPSIVELTVGDRVQLDRLIPSNQGCVAERHGRLLDPGVTTVALAQGHYFFRTLADANLRVVRGGVAAKIHADDKDGGIDPPKALGDEVPGELPSLTIEHA